MPINYIPMPEKDRIKDTAPDFLCFHSGFSDKQLDDIIEYYRSSGLKQASIIGDTNNKNFRIAEVSIIEYELDSIWIYDRLTELVEEANKEFKFDLDSIVEEPQFIEYKPGAHIDWHMDRNPISAIRKLNLSIQLTDPNDYEGGDLLFNRGDQIIKMPRDRGSISFFPSFALHKVSPVTSGVRNSIICWITGPAFK